MSPIVGIGEVLWDVYPDGRKVAGGAPFNFAFHCHQLGHDAVIVSRVGNDDLGRELREEVRRLGLTDDFIQTDREHPTGTVRVTLDHNKVPCYTITDDVAWDYIAEEAELFDEGFAHDVVAVCYGTLALRHPVSRQTLLRRVRPDSDMPSALRVFDLNIRRPFEPTLSTLRQCCDWADWIKQGADDLPVGPRSLSALLEDWSVALELDEYPKVQILTMGGNGVEFRCGHGEVIHEPGVPANVVDTVGAGDAFTAAMVCLHLEGRSLRDCARFANHYAARVCEFQGATPRIDRAEIERAAFGS